MTVKELIEELQRENPDSLVVMSRDAEGNGYSPLEAIDVGKYDPDSTWSGEWWDQYQLDEMAEMEPEDAEALHGSLSDKAVEAVCLWPVN